MELVEHFPGAHETKDPREGINPHANLHFTRKFLEQDLFLTMVGLGIKSVLDVGGHVRRAGHAAEVCGIGYHSANPILSDVDIVRNNGYRSTKHSWCEHNAVHCTCSVHAAVMSVHSLYYLHPQNWAELVNDSVKRVGFAVVHQLVEDVGILPKGCGVPEAHYRRLADASYTMSVEGNSHSYVHPNIDWLFGSSSMEFPELNITLAWVLLKEVQGSALYQFVVHDGVGVPKAPKPITRLPGDIPDDVLKEVGLTRVWTYGRFAYVTNTGERVNVLSNLLYGLKAFQAGKEFNAVTYRTLLARAKVLTSSWPTAINGAPWFSEALLWTVAVAFTQCSIEANAVHSHMRSHGLAFLGHVKYGSSYYMLNFVTIWWRKVLHGLIGLIWATLALLAHACWWGGLGIVGLLGEHAGDTSKLQIMLVFWCALAGLVLFCKEAVLKGRRVTVLRAPLDQVTKFEVDTILVNELIITKQKELRDAAEVTAKAKLEARKAAAAAESEGQKFDINAALNDAIFKGTGESLKVKFVEEARPKPGPLAYVCSEVLGGPNNPSNSEANQASALLERFAKMGKPGVLDSHAAAKLRKHGDFMRKHFLPDKQWIAEYEARHPRYGMREWLANHYGRRDDPKMVSRYLEAIERVEAGFEVEFSTEGHVKDENSPQKFDNQKCRGIYAPNDEYTVAASPDISWCNSMLKAWWGLESHILYASGVNPDQLGMWFQTNKEGLGGDETVILEGDASAFEASITVQHIEEECRMMEWFGADPKYLRMQTHGKMKDARGLFTYNTVGKRHSGVPNTSICNTYETASSMVQFLHQELKMTPAQIKKHWAMGVLGDDNLSILSARLGAQVVMEQYVRWMKRYQGFDITGKLTPGSEAQKAEFCSGWFMHNSEVNRTVWTPKFGRVLSKTFCLSQSVQDHRPVLKGMARGLNVFGASPSIRLLCHAVDTLCGDAEAVNRPNDWAYLNIGLSNKDIDLNIPMVLWHEEAARYGIDGFDLMSSVNDLMVDLVANGFPYMVPASNAVMYDVIKFDMAFDLEDMFKSRRTDWQATRWEFAPVATYQRHWISKRQKMGKVKELPVVLEFGVEDPHYDQAGWQVWPDDESAPQMGGPSEDAGRGGTGGA